MAAAEGAEDSRSHGSLQTVARALSVLRLFASTDEIGVREIGRRLDISPTIVHRIMATLSTQGFVVRDERSRAYRLGPAIRALADRGSITDVDLRRLALPHMSRLQALIGETICLQSAQNGYRLVIAEIESPHELRMVVPARPYRILTASSADQVFNAFSGRAISHPLDPPPDPLPEQERRILDGETDAPDLDEVRRQGWAVSYGVWFAGGISVAAPVRAHAGLFALTVFGPATRMLEYTPQRVGEQTGAVAAELAASLDAHRSPPDVDP